VATLTLTNNNILDILKSRIDFHSVDYCEIKGFATVRCRI